MTSAGARAYNEGLGQTPPRGPEAEPLVRGQWALKDFLGIGRLK